MATPMDVARRMSMAMLNEAREAPGTIVSRERGRGEQQRFVSARWDGDQFEVLLMAWGFPERYITGSWMQIWSECAVTLEGAG